MDLEKSHSKGVNLLDLSDCVIIIILSYLDSTSLYNLSQTCTYFEYIVKDLKLWRYIDARAEPNTAAKVNYCVNNINEKTSCLFLRGSGKKETQLPKSFFTLSINFDNIKVLVLEKQYINGELVTINNFPKCLEELSLRQTYVKHSTNFFRYSHENMKKLRVLILDECEWIVCSFMMSLALYQSLEILSTVKCDKLIQNTAYLGLSRHGFKRLKTFDCRFTGLGHNLLRSFHKSQTFQAIYFQHDKTYELDYGSKFPYYRNYDYNEKQVHDFYWAYAYQILSDESLIDYRNCSGMDIVETLAESVLYTDPYGECTCGYKDRMRSTNLEDRSPTFDEHDGKGLIDNDVNIDGEDNERQFIPRYFCRKHRSSKDREHSDDEDSLSEHEFCETCTTEFLPRTRIVVNIFTSHNVNINLDSGGVNNESSEESQETEKENLDAAGQASTSQGSGKAENRKSKSLEKAGSSINDTHQADSNERSKREMEYSDSNDDRSKNLREDEVKVQVHIERTALEKPSTSKSDTHLQGQNKERSKRKIEYSDSDDDKQENEVKVQVHIEKTTPKRRKKEFSEQENSNNCAGPSNARLPEDPHNNDQPPSRNEARIRIVTPQRHDRLDYFHFQCIPQEMMEKTKIPLRRLSLRGFRKITDIGLSYIQDLKIDLLDVTYTKVTRRGIESFLAYNPTCRIIHPLYCKCIPRNHK